jgi:small subunit ribosomal protein S1
MNNESNEKNKQDQPMTSASAEQELESGAEMGMAELLAQEERASSESAAENKSTPFIEATVVSITKDGVLVDIGAKSEALIPIEEFSGPVPFAVGDVVSVMRKPRAKDGPPRVSWKAAREQSAWVDIDKIIKERKPLQARVKSEIRGGLLAELENGLTGFIPASQVDVRPTHDLKRWKGQTVTVYIMEADARKNNLVLSRKQWMAEQNEKKKGETLSTLKVGEVRKGTVTGITSFGAFVDIGGVEGLLHIGELEWARTSKVADVLKVGDAVEVKVIRFDPESGKISLSRKELLPHPWLDVEQRFPAGSVVKGKVTTLTDFGAFVELAPRIEGLVHSTEISWKTGGKPQEQLKAGDVVDVKVLSVNREKEKISLSIKRVSSNPWDEIAQKYPAGTTVKVVVTSLAPFGAFARLPEGIEGLIHVSDFYWSKRLRHPEDVLKVGDEIEVKVLEYDREKEKMSFGIKQLKPSPYELYTKGAKVNGTVTKVSDAGVFVELDAEVEAYMPGTEVSSDRFEKPTDILKVGDKIEAKVILVDLKERKIHVSIRQLERDLQRAAAKKYSGKARGPVLGELLDS